MPYCKLPDGTNIYFEIYGSELDLHDNVARYKPTIVVLHGGPDADHTFHVPFYKQCAEFAQVIMLDHRGCGRSYCDDASKWNLKQWARDVNDFCQILSIEKPYISGISFGGVVALQHAILFSDKTSGLILIDTEASFDKTELLDAFQAIGGESSRQAAEAFYDNPSADNQDNFVKFCVPLFSRKPFPLELGKPCTFNPNIAPYYIKNELFKFNFLSELSKVTSPVLYINGTINPVHRKDNAERTAKAFVNTQVQLELFDNDGFTTVDNPEKVASKIRQFVCKS